MSEVEKTMEELEWNKRLKDISPSEETESKSDRTSDILVAFLIGFLFGLIVASILVPNLAGLI
ncbi:MAG: hypothetical protein ACLFSM_00035 [Thermoplasmata archaeon]